MNKNKMIILVAIIMVIMLCPKNVLATQSYSNEKCESVLGIDVTGERQGSNGNYTGFKITVKGNKDANIKYKIVTVGDNDDNDNSEIDQLFTKDFDGSYKKLKNNYKPSTRLTGGSDTKTISVGNKPKTVYVFVELDSKFTSGSGNNKIECRAGRIALNSNNKVVIRNTSYDKKGTGYFAYYTIPGKTTPENKMYNTAACTEFRNGQYKKTGPDESKDVKAEYKAGGEASEWYKRAGKYFSYCFNSGSTTTVSFSQSKIRKIKKQFINMFNGIKRVQELEKSEENKEYDTQLNYLKNDSTFKQITTENADTKDDSQYLTNAGTLQCEDDQTNFEDKKFYSSENEILNNDLCKVNCYETFVTTYDPPVTSSSGLCFSYKVTVRSKVYCKTEINNEKLNWPEGVTICASMGAECNGRKEETQAGPADNFDSCVKSCDGGKYSQKCIDKCYNNVYETNIDKEVNSKYSKLASNESNNIKSDSLVLYGNETSNTSLTNMGLSYADYKEEKCEAKEDADPYHYQWDDDKNKCVDVKSSCDSEADIRSNSSACATYFYKAKNQKPFGSYVAADSDKAYTYKWKVKYGAENAPSKNSSHDGSNNYGNIKRSGADSVFNSVKRSAKYYMRSVGQTESLIKSLYGIDSGHNGAGYSRYYNIDNDGVKRQVSNGWHCHEDCGFYPTSGGSVDGNGCVSSVSEAMDYYDKQEGINNELVKECEEAATANCSEEVSTFEIGANNESKKGTPTRDYDADNNRLKNTNQPSKNNENRIENPTDDIFRSIEHYKDYYSGEKDQSDGSGATNCVNGICYDSKEEDGNLSNGINGICYGNKYPYHDYKTTITFPGTCVNDKSGNVNDHPENCNGTKDTNGEYGTLFADQYCLLYNSKAYNSKWWFYKAWGAEKYQAKYGKVYEKTDENRNYNIKSHIEKFGKFNWAVNTQCFYATEDSTAPIDDYVYKVIKVGEAFKKYAKNEIPFNFTKEAKINTIPSDAPEEAKTYSINPEKYVEYINTTEKELFETPEFASSECPGCDYHIKLTGDQLLEIRKHYSNRDYTDYTGSFKKDNTIEGLTHYTSNVLDELSSKYKLTRNKDITNKNNNYYNSSVDLYATNK